MLGPGKSEGSSEVVSLPDLTSTNCSVPVIKGGYYGYVAVPSTDGPMLCGGVGFGKDIQSDCHILTEEGVWVTLPPVLGMKKMRAHAATVEFDKGWLVTGIAKLSSVPLGYFSRTEISLNPDYYPHHPPPTTNPSTPWGK